MDYDSGDSRVISRITDLQRVQLPFHSGLGHNGFPLLGADLMLNE